MRLYLSRGIHRIGLRKDRITSLLRYWYVTPMYCLPDKRWL